jgi:hypothetical protein
VRSRVRTWLIVVAAGAVLASAVIVRLASEGSGGCVLRRQQLERVVPGMTRAEVVTLLGGPPGDYRTDPGRFSVAHHSLYALGFEEWVADEAKAAVWFDPDDRVARVRVCGAIDQHPPLLRRLAGWLLQVCARLGSE